MNMINKVCSNCGTTNLPDEDVCSNCGTPLVAQEAPVSDVEQRCECNNQAAEPCCPEQKENTENSGYSVPPYNIDYDPALNINYTDENGQVVSDAELRRFIFKKPEKIMQKFAAMQISKSKTAWHWPMFVLTLIFGFAGSAFWFFYRKMNKIGAIFMAIAVVFSLGVSILSGELSAKAKAYDKIFDSFGILLENPENLDEFQDAINDALVIEDVELSPITDVASLIEFAAAIVMPILCLGIYKKHCIKNILKIRGIANNQVMSYTMYNQLGGTSSSAVALSIIGYSIGLGIIETVITFIL